MSQTYLSDGLYKVVTKSDKEVIIVLSDSSHNVFKGHFESMPLLPGFLQIDIIAEILNKDINIIITAKFLQKVLPNEKLTYTIEPTKSGVRVKIHNKNKLLCGDFKLKWNTKQLV